MAEKRETKDRLGALQRAALLLPRLEKSGRLTPRECVCVWTLPEPRSKSYGDKSPHDTQTPPFTTEGAYFWPAYLILWRRMQSSEQYFLIQRRNRSKPVIQGKRKKKFTGRAGWAKQQQTAPCHTPGISSHNNKKRKEQRETPFLFSSSFSPLLDVDG